MERILFFLLDPPTTKIYPLSLHDALPIFELPTSLIRQQIDAVVDDIGVQAAKTGRSEEHTSELQSLTNLVCRLLLEKKKLELLGQLSEVFDGEVRVLGSLTLEGLAFDGLL